MKNLRYILTVMLILSSPFLLEGREVLYTGQPVEVNIAAGRATQVVFPANVRNIVTAIDQVQLSVEVFQNILYLQPLYTPRGNLFVNTADGTGYGLFLQTVPALEADSTIKIKVQEVSKPEAKADGTIIHYMRQLITGAGDRTAGVSEPGRIIYEDRNIKITLERAYSWAHYNGWICTAENVSAGAVVVPIQQVSMPKLRAISSDTETLEPKEATRVYILLGK